MRDTGYGHPWNLAPSEARTVQEQISRLVITRDRLGPVRTVGGVDVGFEDNGRITRAAVAVLDFPELRLVDEATARLPTCFPYIPGLLSFREIPAILHALGNLRQTPDLLLCDGQGIAHPRRCGLASHLGVIADIPSIGVAKSRLIGEHSPVPGERGSRATLYDRGEPVGIVLRTRTDVKPLYISIGHRISLPTAVSYVLACTTKYRLPETTRQAHRLASG